MQTQPTEPQGVDTSLAQALWDLLLPDLGEELLSDLARGMLPDPEDVEKKLPAMDQREARKVLLFYALAHRHQARLQKELDKRDTAIMRALIQISQAREKHQSMTSSAALIQDAVDNLELALPEIAAQRDEMAGKSPALAAAPPDPEVPA
jgi:hypothetical protein